VILPWYDAPPSPAASSYLAQFPARVATLLELPPSVADEHGVPVAVYAARRLSASSPAAVASRLQAILAARQLSPAAAHGQEVQEPESGRRQRRG
jgi:hypothetical protein